MIKVITSHDEIYSKEIVMTDIIKEYQSAGSATIHMNNEGPDARAVGLYQMLDYVCKEFNFNKKNIKILTCNAEELHPDYKIIIQPQHWISLTTKAIDELGYSKDSFRHKDVTKNLFGCLYNIPSWDRLCILSHVKFHTAHSSLLGCNLTFDERVYNTVYLDKLIENAPNELYAVTDYIKTKPSAVCGLVSEKPITSIALNEPIKFYNDFFIDIVAETYIHGLTFFITEKTIRPIYALTPFITVGPQGYLSNLKARYGFKTFNQWWDESYDDYQNYDRIKKIYEVIQRIDNLSNTELKEMYNDMTDTLDHNYNRLLELNGK